MGDGSDIPALGLYRVDSLSAAVDRVAIEDGIFTARGLSVSALFGEFSLTTTPGRDIGPGREAVHYIFDLCQEDLISPCERQLLARFRQAEQLGESVYLNPVVVSYALMSVDDLALELPDLTGAVIGTGRTQSQLVAITRMLGAEPAGHTVTLVPGDTDDLLVERLHDGTYSAVVVAEPTISTLLRQGARVVATLSHRGGFAFEPTVPRRARESYLAALDDALAVLWETPERGDAIVSELGGAAQQPLVAPGSFYRFVRPRQVDRAEFARRQAVPGAGTLRAAS
jgi:hypothetical protein